MKRFLLFFLFDTASTGQGKYAGTKKSLIGKSYAESRNLTNLKGWTWLKSGLSTSLDDPERIMPDIFKMGSQS